MKNKNEIKLKTWLYVRSISDFNSEDYKNPGVVLLALKKLLFSKFMYQKWINSIAMLLFNNNLS